MWQCDNLTIWQLDNRTMWQCDNVTIWHYMTIWQYDNMTIWQCDNVTMWKCANVKMWKCDTIMQFLAGQMLPDWMPARFLLSTLAGHWLSVLPLATDCLWENSSTFQKWKIFNQILELTLAGPLYLLYPSWAVNKKASIFIRKFVEILSGIHYQVNYIN